MVTKIVGHFIFLGGIGNFGEVAHYEIPSLCDFVDSNGIRSYDAFLGDDSERGRDSTAVSIIAFEIQVKLISFFVSDTNIFRTKYIQMCQQKKMSKYKRINCAYTAPPQPTKSSTNRHQIQ